MENTKSMVDALISFSFFLQITLKNIRCCMIDRPNFTIKYSNYNMPNTIKLLHLKIEWIQREQEVSYDTL